MCVFLCAHHHIDAIFLQWCFVIGDITDPDNCGGSVMLQVLIEKDCLVIVFFFFADSVNIQMIIYACFRRHIHISYLYEGAECAVCGVVCDQEPHVLVAQFHWSRTIHGGQGAQ